MIKNYKNDTSLFTYNYNINHLYIYIYIYLKHKFKYMVIIYYDKIPVSSFLSKNEIIVFLLYTYLI